MAARRLRDGSWVVVADGSEPLVVSEDAARALVASSGGGVPGEGRPAPGDSLGEVLADAGFLAARQDDLRDVLRAPGGLAWTGLRALVLGWSVAGAGCSLVLLLGDGIPSGEALLVDGASPLVSVVVVVCLAVTTSVLHELGHVVLGNRLGRGRGGLRILAGSATATTDLTHAWAWPGPARLAAVVAGVAVDLLALVVCLLVRHTTAYPPHPAWDCAVSVLVLRIVWQLRFHANCDGRHLARMLLDNPLLDLRGRFPPDSRRPASWLGLVGHAVDLGVVAWWVVPAAAALLRRLT